MPNNTTNISVPVKGMNQDVHPMNIGEQGYDYALNAVVEEFNGNGLPMLQNESSNIPCTKFADGFKVVGYANITEQDRIIVFLVNSLTKECQIGEIIGKGTIENQLSDTGVISHCADCGDQYIPVSTGIEKLHLPPLCVYNIIISSTCLNFSIDHPIRAIYRIQSSCGLQIFFTDNHNPYRYLEFDYLHGDPAQPIVLKDKFKIVTGLDANNCNVPIYSKNVDCNKLLFNPIIEFPCIELVDVLTGGELKAGVYQFAISYAEENGVKRTQYLPATNPIPIFTRSQTFETNYSTNKAIQIAISGITENNPFLYYNLVVIKTIDQQTSFEFVGTFPITQHLITYTGLEKSLIDLTEADIFEPKVYYGKASNIATSNNYLFLAGLEETDKLNVQRIANNVRLQWQTVAIKESVYSHPRFVNRFRSYMRDEVYAFGLVLIFENGEESVVGHIPGPSKTYFHDVYNYNVDNIVNNNDVIVDPSCSLDGVRNKAWQVYNVARLVHTNTSVPITDTCDDGNKCYQYGDFAYWESSELYPNKPDIYGNLCNTPIRHHRFPDSSVTHIHDGFNGTKQFHDANIVFPLGIRVVHTSLISAIQTAIIEGVITRDQANSIKGYRIVRGNRQGNKSIIAKGLLYDVWNYTKNSQTIYFPNYPYNDLHADQTLTEDRAMYNEHNSSSGTADLPFRKTDRYTFHSPDIHFLQPVLGDQLQLETLEYGQSEGYFNHADLQAKQKLLSDFAYITAFTGGVIAMFLETTTVREKSYTIRGKTLAAGTNGIPLMEGGFTAITTIPGTAPTSIITSTSVPAIGTVYNNDTGLPVPPLAYSIDTMTRRGTKEQLLSFSGAAVGAILDPVIGSIVGALATVHAIPYKLGLAITEANIIVNLFKSLIPKKNYSIQYNSIGKYNNYTNVLPAGQKIRKIETYSYLKPEMSLIEEKVTSFGSGLSTIRFNNWNRESSVYLKLPTLGSFAVPTHVDDSKFPIGDSGSSGADFKNYDKKLFYKNISSFYGSIKRTVLDQYGQIGNVEYIDTGCCIFFKDKDYTDCDLSVFGGDTFIPRFAIKRKHSYFLQSRFRDQDESDVKYDELGNVAYPRYYYNSVGGLGTELENSGGILDILKGLVTNISTIPTLLGRPRSFLDCKTNKLFYQNGKIYQYSYGIPYFLCESDINVDMRHGENSKEKDFYPRQQDLDFWLQEKNVPITEDNFFAYNFTYSKQNREHAYTKYPITYKPSENCRLHHPNRIIYSNGTNWLSYKANDFYDFPLINGKLTGIDGIENDKVLVRTHNTTQVFNAYVTIQTSADNISVGTGGMFASKPQEYAHTTLGYAGAQQQAILHTEFGHVWADAKRGEVFLLSPQGLDNISKDGMKNWFKNNLPFQLLKDFPVMTAEEMDNNFKGIGIVMAFDKRFNRFLLTKLDYKVLDPEIKYDVIRKTFYIERLGFREEINITDSAYFCNKSWTVSYNFITKSWVSYHSYLPNYYVDGVDSFLTGVNNNTNSRLWVHSITNKSYQVFYGMLFPFSIQVISKASLNKENLNSVEYALDAIRYHNDFDQFFATNITFNKAIVSNQNQSSGNLILAYHDKNNLNSLINYPITNATSTTIRVTNADGIWRFNQFYDLSYSRMSNMPLWLNTCSNAIKMVNNRAINYQMPDLNKRRIRGEYSKILLSNDLHSEYKLIFKWLVNNSVKTYR